MKKMLQEKCQSVLKTSHTSTRKMRSEILAPVKLPGALTLPSGKAGFHHRFLSKTYQPSVSSRRLPPASPNCHLTGSQGMRENRWEKFLIQMDWYLKQRLYLSRDGSPSVWVTHPCVGVRRLSSWRNMFRSAGRSHPRCHLIFSGMSNTEMSSLWNGCPALL